MTAKKKRILLVDDNASIHEDFKRILQPVLSQAQSRAQALEDDLFGTPEKTDSPPDTKNLHLDYRIDDAFQGEEAVRMAEKAAHEGDPYAVVFMDVRMPPGMDGVRAIQEIWKTQPKIEMVICTAFSDYSWEDIVARLGQTDKLLFVRKPFDAVSIRQAAMALSTKWGLQRQVEAQIEELETKVAERTRELRVLVEEKESYIKAINQDLEFAAIVQRHILPQAMPTMEHASLESCYIPAQNVGGDFYDVIKLDSHKTAVFILDVSGHGIAASLVTTLGKTSFSHQLKSSHSPAEVMRRVNADILALTPEDIYLTAFLMVVDLSTGKAVYTNAGHVPPLLHSARTESIQELSTGDFFVGMLDSVDFKEKELQLGEGDRLLLYTDGLTESADPQGKLFGRSRLKEALLVNATMYGKDLVDRILEANRAFRQNHPPADDICMLLLEKQESPFLKALRTFFSEEGACLSFYSLGIALEREIDAACSVILKELDRNGFRDAVIKQMRIALVEILLNSIRHGNRSDQSKLVRIGYHVDEVKMLVGILDEGAGFDFSRIGAPQAENDPLSPEGRGLRIARHYVDSMQFLGSGNCVIIIAYRKEKDLPHAASNR